MDRVLKCVKVISQTIRHSSNRLQWTAHEWPSRRIHRQRVASQQPETHRIAYFGLVSGLDDAKGNSIVPGFRYPLIQHRAHPFHHLLRH
jgi:hypothetical protein